MAFKAVYDFLEGADGDLAWVDGDLVWDESTLQHQTDILEAEQGHFTHSPLSGAGLLEFVLDDTDVDDVKKAIQRALVYDGQKVTKLNGNTYSAIEMEAGFAV